MEPIRRGSITFKQFSLQIFQTLDIQIPGEEVFGPQNDTPNTLSVGFLDVLGNNNNFFTTNKKAASIFSALEISSTDFSGP